MVAAFAEAGIPMEAISVWPGGHDVGDSDLGRVPSRVDLRKCSKQLRSTRAIRACKFTGLFLENLFGDDMVDEWEKYLDLMVESVYSNGGRDPVSIAHDDCRLTPHQGNRQGIGRSVGANLR